MSFKFHLPKIVQEVGVLLEAAPEGRYNYTRILKLIYLADRESLSEVGHPISGDRPAVLPFGPVPSTTCDLARESGYASEELTEYWAKYFEQVGKELVLKEVPGTGHLSDYEVERLRSLFDEHKEKTLGQLFDFVGELPEVKKNKIPGSSRTIPLDDILHAIGRADDAEEIKKNQREDEFLSQIFGG